MSTSHGMRAMYVRRHPSFFTAVRTDVRVEFFLCAIH